MSEIETINNPVETIYEYDLDKDARLVYFYSDVNANSVARTIKSLLHLDYVLRDEDDPRIGLYINSDGGSLEDSFALYDCIQSLSAKVITIGTGMVASAAVLLLACGHERYATQNCWVMAHQAEGSAGGNEATVAAIAKVFKELEKQRYSLLAKHTKWTAQQWRAKEHLKGEVWMKPPEMLKVGLIDKVLPPTRPVRRKKTKK